MEKKKRRKVNEVIILEGPACTQEYRRLKDK
jgi:5S rRNA maturation endonuclease (ribonuclease M5)